MRSATLPRNGYAGDTLASNAERMLWQAHQRAAELVDVEPGPISQIIFAVVHREWRNVFLHNKAA